MDRDKDPELRHPVLTLVALHDLEAKIKDAGNDRDSGIEAFINQNHGEGWLLPETLRLADYCLGHDDRARQPQPVASRLGPRFLDWQLTQTPKSPSANLTSTPATSSANTATATSSKTSSSAKRGREPEEADLLRVAESDFKYGAVPPKNPKPGKLF